MSATQSGVQAVGVQDPNARTVTWKLVLARTYQLYAQRFWTYFLIGIVPAMIAYGFNYFVRTVIRNLARGSFTIDGAKLMAAVTAIEWARGIIFWMISAFFFAAIAATFVLEGPNGPPAVADAYTLPRRRLGSVAVVSLLTGTLFYVGRVLAAFAVVGLANRIRLRNSWVLAGSTYVMFLALATLLCKFGMAIPELMHCSDSTAGGAMKRALKETEGWEGFFAMFLIKSAAIGYGIYWIANWGLHLFWQHTTVSANNYLWVRSGVYIFIAAVVETPLFIAFSVLYTELQAKDESPDPSAIH
jgi:hypothetical protein